MPRLRTLKPSFFTNEVLGELPPLTRLLFQGLWCHADRLGRLEDRPKMLKAVILPYDACDPDAMLQVLHDHGFIIRYRAEGRRLITIPKFRDHQKPHPKEPELGLPAYEPGKGLDEPETFPTEPEKDLVEPGGLLSLVSCPLSSGNDEPASPESPPPSDPVAAMGATVLPAAALRTLADQRDPTSPGAAIREEDDRRAPLHYEKPTTPPEGWLGPDFFRWAQHIRQINGYIAEKWPKGHSLRDWFSSAISTPGVTVQRLKEGFYAYGADPYWKQKKAPFHGFIDQWPRFMPPEVAHAS